MATTASVPGTFERATVALSVIVPAHNNPEQLDACLTALRASHFRDFEIIVVDDCSTVNVRSVAERHGARYVRTPRNLGPGGARNLAADLAQGEVLVFVDSDVCPAPNALPRMVAHFQLDPGLAGVFGSYDEHPTARNFLSQFKNLMHHYVHQVSSENACSFWAGCGAMRKSDFLEAGGFDATAFPRPSIEDIELGYRVIRSGKRILLDKQIQGRHLKRWNLRNLLHADIFCRAVPWTRLIRQTGNLPRDLNLGYSARICTLLVGLLMVALMLLPLTAMGADWLPKARVIAAAIAVIAATLVLLNRRMYGWFLQRRGLGFTVGVALFHWLYFLYSGIVFVICSVIYRPTAAQGSAANVTATAAGARD